MKRVVEMSRAYNKCRSMFNDGDVEQTFNEALILGVIYDKALMMKELERELFKDRGYVSRVMKKMIDIGFVVKEERLYTLTLKGRKEAARNCYIFQEIEKDLDDGGECCRGISRCNEI